VQPGLAQFFATTLPSDVTCAVQRKREWPTLGNRAYPHAYAYRCANTNTNARPRHVGPMHHSAMRPTNRPDDGIFWHQQRDISMHELIQRL
jgi:hypothetical protein